MADKDDTFFRELVEHHVSGQLKVAPEHVAANTLKYMGKPSGDTYDRFREKFFKINKQLGKEQYLIPYLMSSHPGSGLNEAIELAEYLRDTKYQPEQVQDFYPTPGTLSTAMFYTGVDPITGKEVYIPKTREEKAMQRALLQFKNPKNYNLVHDALVKAGREDLIGNGPKCLIKSKADRYMAKMKKEEAIARGSSNRGKQGSKSKSSSKSASKMNSKSNSKSINNKGAAKEKFGDFKGKGPKSRSSKSNSRKGR